ncbi:MAG: hypothetical protein CME21_21295 [Gemmatimonadetes bacterium]|nr:hypothetical protein [Gemmatimonadota bacterium]
MTESRKEGSSSRLRDTETRDTEMRDKPWKPAPLLPSPNPREGLDFRYVRVSMRGEADNVNASQAFREGWEPVLSADYPELKVVSDRGSDFPDNVVVGGLLLCARPVEIGQQIDEHRQKEVNAQMEAVDRNYFREQDPRMPMLQPERRSRVSFGDN